MKVVYTSPVFHNIDGTARQFMVHVDGLKTYKARDAALVKIMALGGINAPDTVEVQKLMSAIRSAKRKIERQGWFSYPADPVTK